MTFLLAQKRKELFFALKVVCPQYSFGLPDFIGQLLFLDLSKGLPESDFYLSSLGRQYLVSQKC